MDQPTTRPVDGDLPESPWAQHFRPSKDPKFRSLGDGLHHSGMAPLFPSISWRDLGRGTLPMDQVPPPPMAQLDALFYSERYQRSNRAGVMSWRLDALTRSLNDLTDRADIENDPNLIQVNEDGWLDFLKRNRWFDLRVDAVASIPFPEPELLNYHNRWWTVDNPSIWKYMRIALEVVNRTLNTIIEACHPWLDTVLFSNIQSWSDVDQEMADFCMFTGVESPSVLLQRPESERATAAELRAELQSVLLFCTLGFVDEKSMNQTQHCLGYSAWVFDQEAVENLRELLKGEIHSVVPALRSSTNRHILPRYVRRPPVNSQSRSGSPEVTESNPNAQDDLVHLPESEATQPLEELIGQAAAELGARNPDGSVMNAVEFVDAVSDDLSADEFTWDPPDCFMANLHIAPLRCLLSTESRPFEKYNAILGLVDVILHEIAHSIFNGRRRKEPEPWAPFMQEPIIPPFLGREAGYVFEQNFFNGVLEAEFVTEDSADYANGANTNWSIPAWPQHSDCTGMIPERWCPPFTNQMTRKIAPSLFATSLASEAYWNTVVSKWGTYGIRAPNILSSWGRTGTSHIFTRWHSPRLTHPATDVAPEMIDKYKAFQRDWNRLTTWNATARPWWEAEYLKWSLSPWSQVNARRWILEFREAHARRDLARCTRTLWDMIKWIGEIQFNNGFDRWAGPVTNLWGCIASLMMASIPIMAGMAGWKGPLLAYWAHPSVAAQTRWTKPLTLHPMTLEAFQKKTEVEPGPWSDPEGSLIAFWNRFCPMGMMWDIPHVWLDACYDTYQQLWVHHYTMKSPWHWGEFDFEIPEYDDKWVRITNNSYNTTFYNIPILQWTQSYAPAGLDRGFYLPSAPSSPIPSWRSPDSSSSPPDSRARQTRRTPSPARPRGRALYPVHYSTGEVGNNMDDEDFWVIESDGNDGYDIFSIRELCLQLGHPTAEMIRRELITLSPLGPKLREDGHPGADQIRSQLIQVCPKKGKLLVPRTADEISEYDGQGGMPLWIVIGTTVYDITKFFYGTQKEKTQLTENPGSRPKSLPDDPEAYDDLLLRLYPYRCALFKGQKARPKTVLPLFTPSMLRWHDNPTAGMYIAVDGIVYNVTDYVDRHPGGRDIMAQALGREASKFSDYHASNTMADHAELAVGRLVPEIAPTKLQPQQLVIHDWVFDLTKLQAAEDERARRLVAHLGGTDASDAIRADDAAARALVHVYSRCKQAVVGRVASAKVREIPTGEVARHDDPRSFQGAWVTIDRDVYDVTTLMLHGKSIHGQEVPHMWAGQEVQDLALRKWLRDDFPYRIVGRAVPGEAEPEPTVEELMKRHCGIDTAEDKAERAARKKVYGIDEDDPTLGGLIHICSGTRTRTRRQTHNKGVGYGPYYRMADAARGRKRSASAEEGGGDGAGSAMKKRGMFDKI